MKQKILFHLVLQFQTKTLLGSLFLLILFYLVSGSIEDTLIPPLTSSFTRKIIYSSLKEGFSDWIMFLLILDNVYQDTNISTFRTETQLTFNFDQLSQCGVVREGFKKIFF